MPIYDVVPDSTSRLYDHLLLRFERVDQPRKIALQENMYINLTHLVSLFESQDKYALSVDICLGPGAWL